MSKRCLSRRNGVSRWCPYLPSSTGHGASLFSTGYEAVVDSMSHLYFYCLFLLAIKYMGCIFHLLLMFASHLPEYFGEEETTGCCATACLA